MATYNGEKWIDIQVESVLAQLNAEDELVVVDDVSSDATLDRMRTFKDSRIRLFVNEHNLGVDKTFERALSLARGDYLFLCDQDDIWYSGKVCRIMRAFDENSDVTLVLSEADIIDSIGKATGDSYYGKRGTFIPGVVANLVKSKFLGCSMAIRSEMRSYFLPLPEKVPGHDMWIGLINEVYGKSLFVAEPLIGYRRHGNNTSPEHRQGLWQMLVWRWQLLSGLVKRVLSLSLRRAIPGD
jgi:glycosyltransferase involved in cell wall biosynthesis